MHSLFTITSGQTKNLEVLSESEKLSVYYHDLFDYPLTFADSIRWNTSGKLPVNSHKISVVSKNGYYFLQGKDRLVYKRILRGRISTKKLEIAEKASKVLSLIPSVKMIAVTGSLAMANARDESDIDLFVITSKRLLWTTRILSYLFLKICNFKIRKVGDKSQRDLLCLNMWMDEADLVWKRQDRNLYTAHEIAQILPLVNKSKAYEKFIYKNRWILNFWPNAVKIVNCKLNIGNSRSGKSLLELTAYKIQLNHMKTRITREIVTPTRAIFHLQDWGSYILSRLNP